MEPKWAQSIAWRLSVFAFIASVVLTLTLIGFMVCYEGRRNRQETFITLNAAADWLEKALLEELGPIITIEQDKALSREEQVAAINERLQPIVDHVPYSRLGRGYYSKGVDAIVAIAPSEEPGYLLGRGLTDDHPSSQMYQEDLPSQEEISDVYRGRVARVARLIYREGEPIGHIWVSTPIEEYYAPLVERYPDFLFLLGLAVLIGIFGAVTIGYMVHREASGVAEQINSFTKDPSSYNASTDVTVGVPLEFRELARSHVSMASRLQDLLRQLETSSRVRVLGDLSGAIVHDLRSPLQVVRMSAELGTATVGSDTHRHFDRILSSVDYMDDLMERLLLMVRTSDEHMEKISAEDLVHESAVMAGMLLIDHRIELSVDIEPTLPMIWGNRTALIQALMNLISNSVDAMGEKGVLAIRASTSDQQVIISISDNGPGVPLDIQEDIFTQFFTTKNEGGVGFGLTIARNIVESHNGTISFTSELGVGTTFTISLPILEGD